MSAPLAVGVCVKLSDYALQRDRDYWQGLGREPQKSRAKAEYDGRKALRGVVTEVIPPHGNILGTGYRVTWESSTHYANGHVSECVSSMIEVAS